MKSDEILDLLWDIRENAILGRTHSSNAAIDKVVQAYAQLESERNAAQEALKEARRQNPVGFWRGQFFNNKDCTIITPYEKHWALDGSCQPLFAGPVPAPVVAVPAVPEEWREFANFAARYKTGFHSKMRSGECPCWQCEVMRKARALLQSTQLAAGETK